MWTALALASTLTLTATTIPATRPVSMDPRAPVVSSIVATRTAPGDRPDLEHYNLGKGGLALDGYDPVAYFVAGGGKPRKGREELTLKERGVTYRFATEENRERFRKDPTAFEPAYGGWCAYAMARGKKVEIDPESFRIQDGRLLLFYKSFFNDTRKSWGKKPETYRVQADQAWRRTVGGS